MLYIVYRQNMNPPAPTHQYQRNLKRKRRHVPNAAACTRILKAKQKNKTLAGSKHNEK
jgi:hypothetical protein